MSVSSVFTSPFLFLFLAWIQFPLCTSFMASIHCTLDQLYRFLPFDLAGGIRVPDNKPYSLVGPKRITIFFSREQGKGEIYELETRFGLVTLLVLCNELNIYWPLVLQNKYSHWHTYRWCIFKE